MKNMIKKIIALSLVILTLFLVSCGSSVVKYTYEDGGIVNQKTKEKYNALPIGFEPCGTGEECGKFGEFVLYKVTDMDGNEVGDDWITEEYSGSATTVFYKGELPSFRETDFDICYICEEDAGVVSIATVEEKEEIKAILSTLDNEEKALWPRTDLISIYTLKFHSDSLPAVFYSLIYCVTESGNYIYDRAENNCVAAGDLLLKYIPAE